MLRSPGTAAVLVVAASMLSGGCIRSSSDPLPVEVGYSMLEGCEAPPPPSIGPEPALGDVTRGSRDGHVYAHGYGYLPVPLETVWLALNDPCVSRIRTDSFSWSGPVEDFPLSFRLEVTEDSGTVVGDVEWELTYRGGPITDETGATVGYGMRYQKTNGLANIKVQSGSLEIFPAADDPQHVTEIRVVCWLDAPGQGADVVAGTVTDWFGDIVGELGLTMGGAAVGSQCAGNGLGLR